MTTPSTYERIDASAVPPGLRWDVPPEHRGHTVVVAYGGPPRPEPYANGAPYKRMTDNGLTSIPSGVFYRLLPPPATP